MKFLDPKEAEKFKNKSVYSFKGHPILGVVQGRKTNSCNIGSVLISFS